MCNLLQDFDLPSTRPSMMQIAHTAHALGRGQAHADAGKSGASYSMDYKKMSIYSAAILRAAFVSLRQSLANSNAPLHVKTDII